MLKKVIVIIFFSLLIIDGKQKYNLFFLPIRPGWSDMIFLFIFFSQYVQCNKWVDQGRIDRAMLIFNSTKFSENLVLWQNTRECHHCSWIRARDKNGNVIPPFKPNMQYIAWIDTRWPQRFRLAKESSTNTGW